jgi:hypothetical protein
MTTTLPDWLARHGCNLRIAPNGRDHLVLINDSPQYILTVVPAKGHFACSVIQSVNGKRVDSGKVWPEADAALQGGFEDLRTHLGW